MRSDSASKLHSFWGEPRVVLDFQAQTMKLYSPGQNVSQQIKDSFSKVQFESLPLLKTQPDGSFDTAVVNTSLQNKSPQKTMIDTGSPTTHFSKEYVQPTQTLAGMNMASSGSGTHVLARTSNQTLVIGQKQIPLESLSLYAYPESSSIDAVVGMDVLQNKILVLDKKDGLSIGF